MHHNKKKIFIALAAILFFFTAGPRPVQAGILGDVFWQRGPEQGGFEKWARGVGSETSEGWQEGWGARYPESEDPNNIYGKNIWKKIQDGLAPTSEELYGSVNVFSEPYVNSPVRAVVLYIRFFITIIALIFLCLLVYAGILWMQARGNEEQAKKAKDIIRGCFIGIVIVFAAYTFTFVVVRALSQLSQDTSSSILNPTLNEEEEPLYDYPYHVPVDKVEDEDEDED